MPKNRTSVAVIGGGLAGLSAGAALANAGFKVTLFERRPFVGGRASSYEHPGTQEVIDNCQHVLLGCCTNLLDLYDRYGVRDRIRWFDNLTFIEPGGRCSQLHPSGLPAPFHSSWSFLMAPMLTLGDKLAIARIMMMLIGGIPEDTDENFLHWLERHGQTPRAIERFWKTVLVSALNEDLDCISIHYGAQVFRESFLKSAAAGLMGVPTVPLTELYAAGTEYITNRGGEVKLRTSVEAVMPAADAVSIRASGEEQRFDYAIVTVPYFSLEKMLPTNPESDALRENAQKFESSPITGIHLWFDRHITDMPHAVLLERTIQWMFNKSVLQERFADEEKNQGTYLELVVSASKSLVHMQRQEIIDLALKELAEFFPAVKDAQLVKGTVIKEVHATYSAQPLSDRYRPLAATVWPRIFLGGDWTRTGWPATMEGAVRSGYIAAEALVNSMGHKDSFIKPDLPSQGLMRFFS
jgi:squalene-associated FAD-dependent desaturase